MKKKILLFIAIFLSVNINFISAKSIKVLVVGNSFSVDAVENYLYELTEAAGDTIVIGNMYIGGAGLMTHYDNSVSNSAAYSYRKIVNGVKVTKNNFTLLAAVTDDVWDYIVLQQSPGNSGKYDTYFPYLRNLVEYVRQHCINLEMKVAFHTTWAFANDVKLTAYADYGRNQMNMYNAIIDASKRATSEAGIELVIPAGTAIQNGRSSSLGDTFCRDGYHLQLTYGRFTAACIWYEKLFEKSVVENSYIPPTMSYYQAKVARHAAHNAALNPNSVTTLSDLEDDTPIGIFDGIINVSFANDPRNTSWNVLVDYQKGFSIENLRQSNGKITSVSLTVFDGFRGVSTSGVTSNTLTPQGVPPEVLFQSFYGNAKPYNNVTEPSGGIVFSGLSPLTEYDFTIFASMLNSRDMKECSYKIIGNNVTGNTYYLNASNNTLNPLVVRNIMSNSLGEIKMEIAAGPNNNNSAQFYYITALILSPSSYTSVVNVRPDAVEIYPNPASHFITVSTMNENRIDLKIINMDGQAILNRAIDNKEKIDVGNLAKGIYVMQINGEALKVVKN